MRTTKAQIHKEICANITTKYAKMPKKTMGIWLGWKVVGLESGWVGKTMDDISEIKRHQNIQQSKGTLKKNT